MMIQDLIDELKATEERIAELKAPIPELLPLEMRASEIENLLDLESLVA